MNKTAEDFFGACYVCLLVIAFWASIALCVFGPIS